MGIQQEWGSAEILGGALQGARAACIGQHACAPTERRLQAAIKVAGHLSALLRFASDEPVFPV
eukprot:15447048-Alexandrium_andersonii.AAC.1